MANDRDRFDRDRYERDRHERDDRGTVERAGDEVRSWFGDDEARRRRERDDREEGRSNRDDRWRSGERAWGSERSYSSDRPYGDRDYGWSSEAARREGSREFGDRSVTPERPFRGNPAYQPFARGSQEFGPEGYGSASYSTTRARESQSAERWRVPGPHVGRGPKGYQRSDERMREEISDRLTAHGLVDATDVEVRIEQGEVTLTGFVDSRDAKRAAEDCAEDVQGVREVHNHLRIRSHADDTGVGRTSILGLTEQDTQNKETARTLDARDQARGQGDASKSRPRNQ